MSTERMIMGRNSVTEALKAGRKITKVYIAAGKDAARLASIQELADTMGVPVEQVPMKNLNRMAPDARHQGVIATAPPFAYADLDDVLLGAEQAGCVPF